MRMQARVPSKACTALPADVTQQGNWLVVRFSAPQRTVSWAIVGGGLRRAQTVAWLRVFETELRPPVNAQRFLRSRLRAAGIPDAVGLLTSRDLASNVDTTRRFGDWSARCIATVGLGNALRAGDLPGPAGKIGTINLLCQVSAPLSLEALLEGLALAAEARALAVREAALPSQLSGEPASGTGTDCIVLAAPEGKEPTRYVGKHTVVGHLIGAVVYEATHRGAEQWKEERKGAKEGLL
jgi:adenosylcobinamide amidohydrolase